MRVYDTFVRYYSTFLCKYSLVFLVLTPLFVVLCAIFSFAPPFAPDLPDFSDPTKGFEPRGTFIMDRVVTHQQTFEAATKSGELVCSPDYSKRSKRATAKPLRTCSSYAEQTNFDHYAAKTVYESDGNDLMNLKSIKAICSMEETVLRSDPEFSSWCLRDSNSSCCPSFSIGNYIAELTNKTSCQHITENDVFYVNNLLRNCSPFSGKAGGNPICKSHEKLIKNVFTFIVDKDFTRSSNILKTTMVVSLVSVVPALFDRVYSAHLEDSTPEKDGVKLVAFEFTDLKYDKFNTQLLKDAVFPAIGLICIGIILLVYTHSVIMMLLTIFSVISSIIISYFFYHHVFRLTFFPFLNVITFIFLMGIGADDAFVFSDVWNQAKVANRGGLLVDWMEYALKHAALPMLVTSLTTSSAFYANVVSDITAIRLFGIFAGTAIIINYAFMITWFPAGVIMLEKWKMRHRPSHLANTENICFDKTNPNSVSNVEGDPAVPDSPNASQSKDIEGGKSADVQMLTPTSSTECVQSDKPAEGGCSYDPIHAAQEAHCQNTAQGRPRIFYGILRSKCSRFMTDLFGRWIPKSLSLFYLWIFALLALGIGMLCAVTVSPGLQRPTSSEFQVFSSSHRLEQYNLKYKQKFRIGAKSSKFWAYMFFGIKAEDNGNHLDPGKYGHLAYDSSFDIKSLKAQKWLVELCSRIRRQQFFDKSESWTCFPEEVEKVCSNGNTSTFPFEPDVLKKCFEEKLHPSCHGLWFNSQGEIKALQLQFQTNIPFSNEYSSVENFWEDIKTFTSDALANAPSGLQSGWSITWLRFFALQKSLGSSTFMSLGTSLAISFVVMLLTTMNWVISVYAIFTIMFILSTTVGSLVLAGWELNILESIVMSVAVGLSVDFTLHYGVAYTISAESGRVHQVEYALSHIGPAVTLASITTFIAGVFMMFSTVLAYFQTGQFLTLVMAVSWVYATFFFLSLCYFAGPVGHFGQMNSRNCYSCKVAPDKGSSQGEPAVSSTPL